MKYRSVKKKYNKQRKIRKHTNRKKNTKRKRNTKRRIKRGGAAGGAAGAAGGPAPTRRPDSLDYAGSTLPGRTPKQLIKEAERKRRAEQSYKKTIDEMIVQFMVDIKLRIHDSEQHKSIYELYEYFEKTNFGDYIKMENKFEYYSNFFIILFNNPKTLSDILEIVYVTNNNSNYVENYDDIEILINLYDKIEGRIILPDPIKITFKWVELDDSNDEPPSINVFYLVKKSGIKDPSQEIFEEITNILFYYMKFYIVNKHGRQTPRPPVVRSKFPSYVLRPEDQQPSDRHAVTEVDTGDEEEDPRERRDRPQRDRSPPPRPQEEDRYVWIAVPP